MDEIPRRLLQEVARRERELPRAHPHARRMLAFAALAIVALPALALAAVVGIVLHRALPPLLLIPVVVLAALATAVAVRLRFGHPPEPAGIPLEEARAPDLVALVEEIRQRTGAPELAGILLTRDVNAAVIDRSRRLFARSRPTLLLGLPLLHAMPVDELRAAIAHELGHVTRSHGRLQAWAWRIRQLVQPDVPSSPVVSWWSARRAALERWWLPRFASWTFALARAQEREADDLAASATSPRIAADALTRVPLVQALLEREVWPRLWALQRETPGSVRPQAAIAAFLREPRAEKNDEALLAEILAMPPQPGDAHPVLQARLEALGQEARLPPPVMVPAATLLPSDFAELAARVFDEAWLLARAEDPSHLREQQREPGRVAAHSEEAGPPPWQAERRARWIERRLALEALQQQRLLEPSEAWELAMAVGELEGDAREREILEALHDRAPDHAPTCFELGRLRLRAGDGTGVALLEHAAELDPGLRGRCAEMLLDEAERRGDPAIAAVRRDEVALAHGEEDAARTERESLPLSPSRYVAHGASPESLAALVEVASHLPGARRLLVARRLVKQLPTRRAWLVGLERDPELSEEATKARDAECATALLDAAELGGHVTCLVASLRGRVLLARLAEVPGVVAWTRD